MKNFYAFISDPIKTTSRILQHCVALHFSSAGVHNRRGQLGCHFMVFWRHPSQIIIDFYGIALSYTFFKLTFSHFSMTAYCTNVGTFIL